MDERVRINRTRILSDSWATLTRVWLDYRRSDGRVQELVREIHDHGNGACILLYDPVRRTVVLTRQFRLATYMNGHDGFMIEVPAGLLDGSAPEERIRIETEEETGYVVGEIKEVLSAYMSPGAVTERIHLFIGRYSAADRRSAGGGKPEEGEDIEVFEAGFDEALAMVADGRIKDGKTIMLLQHAALNIFD